jgi:hypothetical protein
MKNKRVTLNIKVKVGYTKGTLSSFNVGRCNVHVNKKLLIKVKEPIMRKTSKRFSQSELGLDKKKSPCGAMQ